MFYDLMSSVWCPLIYHMLCTVRQDWRDTGLIQHIHIITHMLRNVRVYSPTLASTLRASFTFYMYMQLYSALTKTIYFFLTEACKRARFVWPDCVSLGSCWNGLLWPAVHGYVPGDGMYAVILSHELWGLEEIISILIKGGWVLCWFLFSKWAWNLASDM